MVPASSRMGIECWGGRERVWAASVAAARAAPPSPFLSYLGIKTRGTIQLHLADGDAHAADAQVAEAEDARACERGREDARRRARHTLRHHPNPSTPLPPSVTTATWAAWLGQLERHARKRSRP